MTIRVWALLAWMIAVPLVAGAQAPAVRPGGKPAAPAAMTAPAPSAGLIDVNSASLTSLDALPGVGPVRAKAIVDNRPYTDKQDLVSKKVLPPNVFAGIQDKIALVNINTASAADMAKILPNVGAVRAQQIVDKRPYASPKEMVTKGALTGGVFEGIKNLVTSEP